MSSSHIAGEAGPSSSAADEGTAVAENVEKTTRPEMPEAAENNKRCSPSSHENISEDKSKTDSNISTSDAKNSESLSVATKTSASGSVATEQTASPAKVAHRKKSSSELPRRLSNKEMISSRGATRVHGVEDVDVVGMVEEEEDDGEDIVIGREITCSKCLTKSLLEVNQQNIFVIFQLVKICTFLENTCAHIFLSFSGHICLLVR